MGYARLQMTRYLMTAWKTKKNSLALCLWPITALYMVYLWVMKALAKPSPHSLLKGRSLWMIGNVWVGGAGKTPLVLALARLAKAQGRQVALMAKAYGPHQQGLSGVQAVKSDADITQIGDEPLYLYQQTGLPVYVGPHRLAIVEALLKDHPEIDTIISDDGLLDASCPRTHEIVVLDERGWGNGWCLPSGPLRAPASWFTTPTSGIARLWVQQQTQAQSDAEAPNTLISTVPIKRSLSSCATHYLSKDMRELSQLGLEYKSIGAFAGIAKPDLFFEMLQQSGLDLQATIAYQDHGWPTHDHPWQSADIWICTAKDAVKLHQYPTSITQKIWIADLQLKIPDALFSFLHLTRTP